MQKDHTQITVVNAHPTTRLRRASIEAAVRRALGGEHRGEHRGASSVSVILVSDEELLEMNRRFLEHDYLTDVITFPLEEEPLEGEIYISLDRAREQAAEAGVGLYVEVERLAIHGALHLVGYDDATPEERERMRLLEDKYLVEG
jgi:rRNA maturation RNase YbeY